MLRYLKYKGFHAFDSLEKYKNFVVSHTKGVSFQGVSGSTHARATTTIMVITGGPSILEVVKITRELNESKKRVQNIVVFTSDENKDKNEIYLQEDDGLVSAVET